MNVSGPNSSVALLSSRLTLRSALAYATSRLDIVTVASIFNKKRQCSETGEKQRKILRFKSEAFQKCYLWSTLKCLPKSSIKKNFSFFFQGNVEDYFKLFDKFDHCRYSKNVINQKMSFNLLFYFQYY